jgi:hypothetical protein
MHQIMGNFPNSWQVNYAKQVLEHKKNRGNPPFSKIGTPHAVL